MKQEPTTYNILLAYIIYIIDVKLVLIRRIIRNSGLKTLIYGIRNDMQPTCTVKKTDFAKNAQFRLLFLPFFYPKNVNFKKSFCLPHRPPNNNSQTKNRDVP